MFDLLSPSLPSSVLCAFQSTAANTTSDTGAESPPKEEGVPPTESDEAPKQEEAPPKEEEVPPAEAEAPPKKKKVVETTKTVKQVLSSVVETGGVPPLSKKAKRAAKDK